MKTYVEIELIDGTKKILLQDWDRIYRILEKEAFELKFSSKFPFIVKETYRYTSFYFMTYTSGPNVYDKKFKAKCTILQLAKLFNANDTIIPFSAITKQMVHKL